MPFATWSRAISYLHSTMVRFIIWTCDTRDWRLNIYIPLWLDLLFDKKTTTFIFPNDLHSTMVRFIIDPKYFRNDATLQFTFHYG